MFRLDVLQNQWLILTLGLGCGVLFCAILLFLALWRPRPEQDAPSPSRAGGLLSTIPWFLIVLALALAAFMVVFVVGAMRRPPNW